MNHSGLKISIKGAKQNNLQNIDLEIPHYKLITVTGISGSGKSSLAFDTIAAEGKRQYLESIPSFARQFLGKITKPDVDEISGLFPVITVSQKVSGNNAKSTVGTLSELYDYLRLLFARFGNHPDNKKFTRSHFSFNSSLGACPQCFGLGVEEKISIDKLIADPNKTLREGALVPTLPNGYIMYSQVTVDVLNTVCEKHGFSVDIPWKELTNDQKNVILNGSDKIKVLYGKHSLESRLKWSALKAKPREEGFYKGMLPIMSDILRRDRNKNILRFVESLTCNECNGKRLNKESLNVEYQGQTIDYLSDLELHELKDFLQYINANNTAENKILHKMIQQLDLLCNLGVAYLSLSRSSSSLTSGEIQRIKLVNQLSAELSNVLYVFDEPSIGMHAKHKQHMIQILKKLVNRGNTVIVVEHDLEIIRQSDWVIEVGPEAGINGGKLLFNGSIDDFLNSRNSDYSTHTQKALLDEFREEKNKDSFAVSKGFGTSRNDVNVVKLEDFYIENCSKNNLKNISVSIKKSALNAITGVPGSGKSSLIYGCLISELNNVIEVNHKPIGRTPRSNPSTYTGLSDQIRDLFASLPQAKEKGFKKGRFSFNTKGGRCEFCEGAGKIQIGMHYMGNVDIICEACNGKRFNNETLEIKYKEKSIADIYEMSINQAIEFFKNQSKLLKYLKVLHSLGLGYVKLGQSSTTLSGGEAQRIKLATELVKKKGNTSWFILNEPSTGLHHYDTLKLIDALKKLTDQGNTVVYIEYQEQLLKAADWIIELGPESGNNGGELIFQGDWEAFKHKKTLKLNSLKETEENSTFSNHQTLEIFNARTNNLKGIDIAFQKNKITVITGLSGSGKSSLAFDTLYAESQNRFSESLSTYAKSFIKQSNLAVADGFKNLTPVIAIDRRNLPQSQRSTVGTLTGINEKYRFLFSRIAQLEGKHLPAKSFSFNHESGACPTCSGLGKILRADPLKLAPNWNQSIWDGALAHNATIKYYGSADSQFVATLKEVAENYKIDLNKPLKNLTENEQEIVFFGIEEKEWETTWNFKTKTGVGKKQIKSVWKGFCNLIDEEYNRSLHNKTLDRLTSMMSEVDCKKCKGARLNETALSVKIDNKNIHELSLFSIKETISWFEKTPFSKKQGIIVSQIYSLIKPKLDALNELGLGHLSLERTANSLSGGEGQRLQLAKQLNGDLIGITYILDEPTVGLHQKNVSQLLNYIQKLKEKGNTIIIIEHDKDVLKFADQIIEIGPGSGINGGRIIAQGDINTFIKNKDAITAPYIINETFPEAGNRKLNKDSFGFIGVNKHNLINRDFHFHEGGIIAVTGVSGSGKSTLMHFVLEPTLNQKRAVNCKSFYAKNPFDQVITIDQNALSTNHNSTLASFIGILSHLQTLFYNCDENKKLKLKKNAFLYHHKEGRCAYCNGNGQIKISMDFMEDVWNKCDVCDGKRYNQKVFEVTIHGKSIFDILDLSVSELINFLKPLEIKDAKSIIKILIQLQEIGLGHLKLIQATTTLSGGETQRIKLTKQLLESKEQRILYLLDEPSSGLHYKDLDQLISVFNKLADSGHTVMFIEHNPYLISIANQVVEL